MTNFDQQMKQAKNELRTVREALSAAMYDVDSIAVDVDYNVTNSRQREIADAFIAKLTVLRTLIDDAQDRCDAIANDKS